LCGVYSAGYAGGGFNMISALLTIDNTAIINNTALAVAGGGMYISRGGIIPATIVSTNSLFQGNYAVGPDGGGVDIISTDGCLFMNTTFIANTGAWPCELLDLFRQGIEVHRFCLLEDSILPRDNTAVSSFMRELPSPLTSPVAMWSFVILHEMMIVMVMMMMMMMMMMMGIYHCGFTDKTENDKASC
jgi:hypothetical protein